MQPAPKRRQTLHMAKRASASSRVFLVGGDASAVSVAVRTARRRGFRVDEDRTDAPARDPRDIVLRIGACDALIAIDHGSDNAADLYCEVGVALALGLPTLVLAQSHPAQADPHPTVLSLPVVVLPGLSAKSVQAATTKFLASVTNQDKRKSASGRTRALGPRSVEKFLRRCASLPDDSVRRGEAAERLVHDIFVATGATIAVQSGYRRADLVALPSAGGRPIVVEVKATSPRGSRDAHEVPARVGEFAREVRAGAAVVLWFASSRGAAIAHEWRPSPGVAVIEAREFVRRLGTTGLAEACEL